MIYIIVTRMISMIIGGDDMYKIELFAADVLGDITYASTRAYTVNKGLDRVKELIYSDWDQFNVRTNEITIKISKEVDK